MRRSKPDPTDRGACKRVGLDLLARREHSRRELERKLAARGFDAATLGPTLDELEESGALVAARFTESFVRSRGVRGQGPVRIRAELVERGIDDAEATQLLREAGIDWVESARAERRKRFGSGPPRDFKERTRQARFLQYRGFDSASIRAALDPDSAADEAPLR